MVGCPIAKVTECLVYRAKWHFLLFMNNLWEVFIIPTMSDLDAYHAICESHVKLFSTFACWVGAIYVTPSGVVNWRDMCRPLAIERSTELRG